MSPGGIEEKRQEVGAGQKLRVFRTFERSCAGETALYDAVAAALEHLKKGNRDKKVLIVISDGGDNASKHNLSQIRTLTGRPDAIIYTSGIPALNRADAFPQERGDIFLGSEVRAVDRLVYEGCRYGRKHRDGRRLQTRQHLSSRLRANLWQVFKC